MTASIAQRNSTNPWECADGADGAVRIIWGLQREYPSTNTGNL